MNIADVMSTPAVVVAANAPFGEVVDVLVQHDIHAVPVIDARSLLVGVITEADVVRRGGHGRALGIIADELRLAPADWIHKATKATARTLMSRDPRTVSMEDDLGAAAAHMLDHNHHLLPVVDDKQQVLGVVTRRDLLRRFAADDAYIAAEITDVLKNGRRAPENLDIKVTVSGGIVTVRGTTESDEDIRVVEHVIARVPGVFAIRGDLAVRGRPGEVQPEAPGWRSRLTGAGSR